MLAGIAIWWIALKLEKKANQNNEAKQKTIIRDMSDFPEKKKQIMESMAKHPSNINPRRIISFVCACVSLE
jgi:hypothetical protein